MLLELAKKGSFTLKQAAPSNPGRCGSATTNQYEYQVEMAVPSDSLDENDFVFDHLEIQKYFDETFGKEPWILSCEMIGMRAVAHFWLALSKRQPQTIKVNIIADKVDHRTGWDKRIEPNGPVIPLVKSAFANVGNNWVKAATATNVPVSVPPAVAR